VSSRARSVPRTRAPPAPLPPGAAIVTSEERPKCAHARLGPSCTGSSCRGPQIRRMMPVRTIPLRPREQHRDQPPHPSTFRTQSQTGAGPTSAAGERHFLFQGLGCAWRAAAAPAEVNGTGRCLCVCVVCCVLCVRATQCPIVLLALRACVHGHAFLRVCARVHPSCHLHTSIPACYIDGHCPKCIGSVLGVEGFR
jgi:hypothetical protein